MVPDDVQTYITSPDGRLLLAQPYAQTFQPLPDWQLADTLPDGGSVNIQADGVDSSNITRAMGLVPVNARTVTSVMGLGPNIDDEFAISRLEANRKGDRRLE